MNSGNMPASQSMPTAMGQSTQSNNACYGGNDIQKPNRICRDFVQGYCRRKYCRYPHVVSPDLVVFCHDFQNSRCPRINCKFLHYTLEEQEYYRKYNKFPVNVAEMQYDRSSPTAIFCPEMLNTGHCRHRECQYHSENHPTAALPSQPNQNCSAPPMRRIEFDQKWTERSMMIRDNYNQGCDMQRSNGDYMPPNPSQQHHSQQLVDDFGPMKRSSSSERYEPFKRFRGDTDSINSSPDMIGILRRFEEEISQLRRRVEANEVKVAELRASNDYLMSQNAQLRLSNAQQCSAVVNPVTVTTSQPQATQVINAVSMAPVQTVQVQATPIVSMSGQTQIIASSSCTPLAIAATSQGQQLAQLTQQGMSTLSTSSQPMNASQILGTSQITLTPTLATAPSMGLAINTSQALAMSNATQPIISYPVMTHSILPH